MLAVSAGVGRSCASGRPLAETATPLAEEIAGEIPILEYPLEQLATPLTGSRAPLYS
jgi:hypothetical protein